LQANKSSFNTFDVEDKIHLFPAFKHLTNMRATRIASIILAAFLAVSALAAWKPEWTARVKLAAFDWWEQISPAPNTPAPLAPVARLRQLQTRMAQKDAEIFELEQALGEFEGFRRALPTFQIIAAQVVKYSDFGNEAALNAGAADGVQAGWGAAQGEVLAGIIGAVGKRASCLLLAANPACVVPARTGASREICLTRGAGGEHATVVFYSDQTAVAPGEKIFTPGLLGKLPPGLLIGTVETFPLRGKYSGTMEARVKLAANFAALEHLIIVAPLPASIYD
jgi:cell shape-determining protein MreC